MRKNAGKYVWTNANVIGRGREREMARMGKRRVEIDWSGRQKLVQVAVAGLYQ